MHFCMQPNRRGALFSHRRQSDLPSARNGIGYDEGIASEVDVALAPFCQPDVRDASAESASLGNCRLVATDVDRTGIRRPIELQNEFRMMDEKMLSERMVLLRGGNLNSQES